MVLFVEDSFESGIIESVWRAVGSGAEISTTFPKSGTYHAIFTAPAGAPQIDNRLEAQVNAPLVFARGYFLMNQGLVDLVDPGDRFNFISMGRPAMFTSAGVARGTDGQLCWRVIVSKTATTYVTQEAKTPLPAEGRYYCVEYVVKMGAGNGEATLYVDGSIVIHLTDLDTTNAGAEPNITVVRFGIWSAEGAPTGNMPFIEVFGDDFAVADEYIGLIEPPVPVTPTPPNYVIPLVLIAGVVAVVVIARR